MSPPIRVIFAGTPEFAAVALRALLDAGFAVPLVLTQPDRPAGRGMSLHASAVKQVALARGLPVLQVASLKKDADAAIAQLQATPHDVMVVAAYGLILPPAVLALPRAGCINIHASLLPRWRGAAPIHRAIEAGDAETGVCIMGMEAGLDTGPVFARAALPIDAQDTTTTLHDKLAALGARLTVEVLPEIVAGRLTSIPQAADGVTYAAKIEKSEAPLDFNQSATVLARQVRAFNPFPGATLRWRDLTLKAFAAEAVADRVAGIVAVDAASAAPGVVLEANASGIVIQCGAGALRLTELQKPGGKRLGAHAFLQSTPIAVGDLCA